MSNISMVAPSSFFFISFEIKPDVTSSDFTTKKRIFTTFWFQIVKVGRCYCHDLGQSERNIFDFSLCAIHHCSSMFYYKMTLGSKIHLVWGITTTLLLLVICFAKLQLILGCREKTNSVCNWQQFS